MRVIRFLNCNSLVPRELAYLREQHPGLLNWRYTAFYPLLLLGWLASLLPLVVYITTDYTRLLAGMAAAIIAANSVTALRTVIIASRTMSRDFPPARWEMLITSGADARQIVLGKWWAVVRHIWRWHLLTGLMWVGLALGIAQHTYASSLFKSCATPFYNTICYTGLLEHKYMPPTFTPQYPAIYKIVLAALIVLVGSLVNAGLMAVLGTFSALLARHHRFHSTRLAIVSYVFLTIFVFYFAADLAYQPPNNYYPGTEIPKINLNWFTFHGATMVLDSGTLLASAVMRPYDPSAVNTLIGLFWVIASLGFCTALIGCGLQFNMSQIMVQGGQAPANIIKEHLTHWQRNPIIQSYHYLASSKQLNPWRKDVLRSSFIIALGIMWITRCWFPLHQTNGPRLWILAGVMVLVRAIVTLQTLVVAIKVRPYEFSGPAWDVLILAGIDARRLIYGHWWNTIRRTWIYHAMATPIMLGFVLDLVQYVSDAPIFISSHRSFNMPSDLERAFGHITTTFTGGAGQGFSPALFEEKTLFVGFFLVFIALMEVMLLSAIGLLSALITPRQRIIQLSIAISLRTILVMGCMWFIWQSAAIEHPQIGSSPWETGSAIERWEGFNWSKLLDTAEIAVSPLADGGLATSTFYYPRYTSATNIREGLGLTLGLGLYALITLLTLQAAQKVAIRRGALPPAIHNRRGN